MLGNEVAFNEAIIDEREQGIRDIQVEIGQANEIFKDLAVLIHGQGVVIGEILKTQLEKKINFVFLFPRDHH